MKNVLNVLGNPIKNVILNEEGKPIVLNRLEQLMADRQQKVMNALGLEINITTLTTIMKKITEQKFYEIAPADYLPLRVGGEGAWSTNLVTYRSFTEGDLFEAGILNQGTNNGRLPGADAAVDSVSVKVFNWAKSIGWNIMELNQASKAGNWDIVAAKEKARKKNWDLGIQKVAFLGAKDLNGSAGKCQGLLNMTGVKKDTTIINKFIKDMSPAELKVFVSKIIGEYRKTSKFTAWPTHFIIPENDWNGLTSQASSDFPIKSTIELLQEAFKAAVPNGRFKSILPLSYGNKELNPMGVNRYVLLNYDEESLRMDIPVDYTVTVPNSLDNFSMQNVGYGQFTGVVPYRVREIEYFDHTL
jgi:hypothetical protein